MGVMDKRNLIGQNSIWGQLSPYFTSSDNLRYSSIQ